MLLQNATKADVYALQGRVGIVEAGILERVAGVEARLEGMEVWMRATLLQVSVCVQHSRLTQYGGRGS